MRRRRLEGGLDAEVVFESRIGDRVEVIEAIVRGAEIQHRGCVDGEDIIEDFHVVVAMLGPVSLQRRDRKAVLVAELDAPVAGAVDEHAVAITEVMVEADQVRVVAVDAQIRRGRVVIGR